MADIYHSQLEASRRFAEVLFSGTERIDHVVLEATHRAFNNNLNLAHAAVSMRDPKELANMQSSMLAHRPDSALNFQKEIMRVFAEIQNEMGKSMKEYAEKFGSNISRGATAPLKSVQDRTTETIFNPLTGIFSLWESTFREVASMANKNITAARTGVQRATEDALQTTVRVTEASADAAVDVAAAAMPERMRSEIAVQGPSSNGSSGGNGSSASGGSASERPAELHTERQAERQPERQPERQVTRTESAEVQEERRPHTTTGRRK
jgi:hypothetical protein